MEKEEELDTEEEKSDQIELYIRWWQLNVFLPMLHFIKPPTTFPENKVSTRRPVPSTDQAIPCCFYFRIS